MAKKIPSPTEAVRELGISGNNVHNGGIRADEFLPELKGRKAIKKFREMRENDSTIGAVLYSAEQILRDVDLRVKPADDSPEAQAAAGFLESVLEDMDHSLDDHISESLSFLSYGFMWFELVYKRRKDGKLGIKKIAARAPWTIDRFDVELKSGDVLGVYQSSSRPGSISNYIPKSKSIHYKTHTINGDPSGRSILRNAYTSYEYLNNLQAIEAIAVERELAGIPVGRLPSEYLSADATDTQAAIKAEFETILRDVKFNEQGYLILPSDMYPDKDGSPTSNPLVNIELMSSSGTRNIEIDPIVSRYQHDIARSVLSEFLLLGSQQSGGSYALSKSKTDIYLRALESYITTITDVLNKQLVKPLWELNGLSPETMPKINASDVAPHDLQQISGFLRNLNQANITVHDHPEVIQDLMDIAELSYEPKDTLSEPTSVNGTPEPDSQRSFEFDEDDGQGAE